MPPTILVVDDDAANRELLEELLHIQGCSTITASDGQEALDHFVRCAPDLVLLDVQMPKLDGFEVCRRIKSNAGTALTPVVLVTALRATVDRIRGLEAGADDFLSKPVDPSELMARVRSLLRLKAQTDELDRAESVLFALARAIEGKDPYTEGHCERLSEYSAQLGAQLGLSNEDITALRRGGIVHDIGKIAVPDAILLKPGRLTPEELAIMRQHPVVGERICAPLHSLRAVLPIIRHHHEKLDGSGYPDGLKGDAIPLTARVLQAVDVYDALTTTRPYRKPFSADEALSTMKTDAGRGWWDRSLLEELESFIAKSRALAPGPDNVKGIVQMLTHGGRADEVDQRTQSAPDSRGRSGDAVRGRGGLAPNHGPAA